MIERGARESVGVIKDNQGGKVLSLGGSQWHGQKI